MSLFGAVLKPRKAKVLMQNNDRTCKIALVSSLIEIVD